MRTATAENGSPLYIGTLTERATLALTANIEFIDTATLLRYKVWNGAWVRYGEKDSELEQAWTEMSYALSENGPVVGYIEETIALADFVDGGGVSGLAPIATALPAGATPLIFAVEMVEGFVGTGNCVASIVVDGTAGGSGLEVSAASGAAFSAEAIAVDIALADWDLEVQLADTTDFGVIVTGAVGSLRVRLTYIQLL